jgi:hypothetical protein
MRPPVQQAAERQADEHDHHPRAIQQAIAVVVRT